MYEIYIFKYISNLLIKTFKGKIKYTRMNARLQRKKIKPRCNLKQKKGFKDVGKKTKEVEHSLNIGGNLTV